MDSIFEEQKPVIVSAKEFKKMESYKKGFETKLFTVAHYLGKKGKGDALAKLSNPKEETKILKYQGITIHKSNNANTYYTRFRVGKKQYYISAYTQRECYEKLKKAKSPTNFAKLLSSQNVITNNVTLEDWYKQWLTLYKIGKVKDETIRSYRSLFNAIPQNIKEMRMADIKLIDLLTLMQSLTSER